jgi:hypothetical protein
MKVIKAILLAILIIFLLLVIVGFFLSADWEVSETVAVQAPAEVVFPLVAEFRQWPRWTAWAEADPDMRYTYSGEEIGVGQVVEWSGNQGSGRMEMTTVDSLRSVDYRFSMDEGTFGAASSIRLEEEEGSTIVTWSSSGDVGSNIPRRYFIRIFQPHMRADYRVGLERLKHVAEMRAAEDQALVK